jgi:hypothetical protein
MHMHSTPAALGAGEEVMLVVPGAREKLAIAVPLRALDRALALVAEAADGVDQSCPCCGGDLAALPSLGS